MAKTRRKDPKLGVDPNRLGGRRSAMEKSLRIRVSREEHDEMADVAAAHGLTVSEYIRQLHHQAVAALKERRQTT